MKKKEPVWQEYFGFIRAIPLFGGIEEQNLRSMMTCVDARVREYPRGDFLLLAGDRIEALGLVLEGGVQILKEDVYGNRSILSQVEPGGIFGESFLCGGEVVLSVSLQAVETSRVLYLDFERVMHTCAKTCAFHDQLITNMVGMIARKNIALMEKLEVATKRTLREKVLAYLSQLSAGQHSREVVSPLGRSELADYLGADRSALTRELGRMQQEGLLRFEKNRYWLQIEEN